MANALWESGSAIQAHTSFHMLCRKRTTRFWPPDTLPQYTPWLTSIPPTTLRRDDPLWPLDPSCGTLSWLPTNELELGSPRQFVGNEFLREG